MGKINSILSQRFKSKEKSSKMEALSQASATGQLTTFSGIFGSFELSDTEKEELKNLLLNHSEDDKSIDTDLKALTTLTCEVKAINHQAIVLHGERIKKAQTILKAYREGAFTNWLINTYGNRQTPYNFLQYYEFYHDMPKDLHPQIERMPRQAVYALASREGPENKKQKIVEQYQGQTKRELLDEIRETFPLPDKDQRRQDHAENVISGLSKICFTLGKPKITVTKQQKTRLGELLSEVQELIDNLS